MVIWETKNLIQQNEILTLEYIRLIMEDNKFTLSYFKIGKDIIVNFKKFFGTYIQDEYTYTLLYSDEAIFEENDPLKLKFYDASEITTLLHSLIYDLAHTEDLKIPVLINNSISRIENREFKTQSIIYSKISTKIFDFALKIPGLESYLFKID
jgi:hypothetical protein